MNDYAPTGLSALATNFGTPRPEIFGPVPIWWWSGDTLTRERLRWQMEQLRSQGVAQAVIMNLAPSGPLYGSLADDPAFMSEAWWDLFLTACADAAELDFRFWPYDQIGFSGANFQGRLVTATPEWAGRSLGRAIEPLREDSATTIIVPQNAEPLAAYVLSADGSRANAVPIDGRGATWSGEGERLVVVYHQEHGFDYFEPAAVDALIDTVHGEFERRAGQWFGSVITGFFQDELPDMPTWGPHFADGFSRVAGYDLLPRLGALWGDPVPAGAPEDDAGGSAASGDSVRLDYQRHRAASARLGFFDRLQAWASERGMQYGFDQQSPAREGDPAGSVGVYADYLGTHGGFSAPGSDHLGDPKVHSSVAHLRGGTRTWIEAFHSSGWGGTLEETYDWLAPFLKRGATLYDPHAVYYSTRGGWWEWAPPSTCWRQPYWPEYHVLSNAVSRLSEVFSAGRLLAETALVFPTTTVQAGRTFDGPTAAAAESGRVYHALNGETAWSSERPGVLDRAGFDYEIVDDSLLAEARLEHGMLTVGESAFRTVILPSVDALPAAVAERLVDLVEAGGRVIVVGSAPSWFLGDPAGGDRFRAALRDGRLRAVVDADDVPAHVLREPVWVDAPVPSLVREIGGALVVGLFAHDAETGTKQPILADGDGYLEWIEVSWSSFWESLRASGYEFRPVGDRAVSITVHGLAADPSRGFDDITVQRWSPVDGSRSTLPTRREDDGSIVVDVDFRDGSVALLVIGSDLPAAPASVPALGTELAEVLPVGPWELDARSTLDNRWGDLAARDRDGVLPLEVWELESRADHPEAEQVWTPVVATYGPYAEVAGPVSADALPPYDWAPAEWSLSRGIRKDPVHHEVLGPKGYVPEEFLHWPSVKAGEIVAVRTWIDVPTDGLHLVCGSTGIARLVADGAEPIGSAEDGYWQTWPIEAGRHHVELRIEAQHDEAVRASFAVVRDLDAYRRPEWLEPDDDSVAASRVVTSSVFSITETPQDGRIQVGAEQPCTVVINGVEIGRQNAFHPYGGHREARVVPYDLSPYLHVGENRLELVSVDPARRVSVVVDSIPARFGGLGLMTGGHGWVATRDGHPVGLRLRSRQWGDPRFLALTARPHPLSRASWLEQPRADDGVVVDLVPDLDPDDAAPRLLRCRLPIGTVSVTLSTALSVTAAVDGRPLAVVDGRIALDRPTTNGAVLVLRFAEPGGRRGGALLDEPLRVETRAVSGPLLDWAELGLGALGGEVAYRAALPVDALRQAERAVLDLGEVRGSVRVLIDDAEVAVLAWGPYRVDITPWVLAGAANIEVRVHNTLAGYLDVASPTPGVFPGQREAGLLGPVRILVGKNDGGAT